MRGLLILTGTGLAWVATAQVFTDAERDKVVAFWNDPDRYKVSAPPLASENGPFQVRLTVEGSQWLWSYDRARGAGKFQEPTAPHPDQKIWDAWIEWKIAWDRARASQQAADANARALAKETLPFEVLEAPKLIPASLLSLVGNPPSFAEVVAPLEHSIRFDEKMTIVYQDNPLSRPRYSYYRFSQGVMSFGTRVRDLPEDSVQKLFAEAGVNGSERKVMAAVSLLEGGFDSVNTYDTGFVSVGLIQFACLKDGAGSLGQVLRREKQDDKDAYEEDFRRFGIDVTDAGALCVIDPSTGAELTAAQAALKIIDDKRLIAVFQRAGKLSKAFRMAQIRVAKAAYYPGDDVVTIQVGGKTLSGPVSTFIKSEAGMATLMDRKVNTGTLEPLPTVLALIAGENRIENFEDLAKYERDIVSAMKFRKDYLGDPTLTQPGVAKRPTRDYGKMARHQTGRKGRGGRAGGSPTKVGVASGLKSALL